MPELPEVETIKSELLLSIKNEEIAKVVVLRPQLLNLPESDFQRACQDQKILSVTRRAKLLIFQFQNSWLLTHLRMTGAYLVEQKGAPSSELEAKATRLIYNLKSGKNLIYSDRRALGKIYLFSTAQKDKFFKSYGLEPFDKAFTPEYLHSRLGKRDLNIKNFLLDQKEIVGIGNIYAAEILFRSKVNPQARTKELKMKQINALQKYTLEVLSEAIKREGTTFSDYRRADGQKGGFQKFLSVYGQGKMPCHVCQTEIIRIVQNSRATFYCPQCQKL